MGAKLISNAQYNPYARMTVTASRRKGVRILTAPVDPTMIPMSRLEALTIVGAIHPGALHSQRQIGHRDLIARRALQVVGLIP